MSTPVRRVVTGHDIHGRAIIVEDGPPTRRFDNLGEPGLVFHEVWNTQETPARIARSSHEPGEARLTLAPPKHGTRIRVLDIPVDDPSAADLDAVFDNIGGRDAHVGARSGKHASYHRTQSVDYGIVLYGEITLVLDDAETTLRAGDICIQRGTSHAWINRGSKPCRIAFVLIDGIWDSDLAQTL